MSRIIKRYGNRKLYDSESKQHVSLEFIAELVREGKDVKVVDNTTDEDITAQTLTQVIFEEGKRGRNPLSSDVLHEVIRWSENVLDDGVKQVKDGIQRIDQFVPGFNKIFNREAESEVDQLKKRIESLENIINLLGEQINQKSQESNKK